MTDRAIQFEALRMQLVTRAAELTRVRPVRYQESYWIEPGTKHDPPTLVLRAAVLAGIGREARGVSMDRSMVLDVFAQMNASDSYLLAWWEEMRFALVEKLEREREGAFK